VHSTINDIILMSVLTSEETSSTFCHLFPDHQLLDVYGPIYHMLKVSPIISPTGWSKQLTPFVLYALISSTIDRFSNLLHCQNQQKMCNNTVTKDPTTPQVCSYTTLWNFSVLKDTIQNETTSVTTHFKSASYGSKVDTLNIWNITAGCVSYFR